MLDTNIATLMNSLRLNINLVYISYRAINVKFSVIIYISDYETRFDKLQKSLNTQDNLTFKRWVSSPIHNNVTKDYIERIYIIELKNIAIEIGASKIDAIDESWNDLFDIYRGYIASFR